MDGRHSPLQKKHKVETDFKKDRVVDHLEQNNRDMLEKMKTLMDLTKGVLNKMK